MRVRLHALVGATFALLAAWSPTDDAMGAQGAPACMDAGRRLEIDNEQALHWKRTTPNQFKARARIAGILIREYPDRPSHGHLQVQIGPRADDTIEAIFNEDFGRLPNDLRPGARVEACGDYITSNAPTDRYQASPDGAIIHWLHYSPRPRSHDHGWFMIDGVVYGASRGTLAPDREEDQECRGRACQDARREREGARDRRGERPAERRAEFGRERWERERDSVPSDFEYEQLEDAI